MLGKIGNDVFEELPEDLNALWKDPGVKEVVKGGSTHTPLTTETLKHCIRLRS